MGKSEKKEKSKRIAALRKEYDEYLEEDKKRKERNDFILGRMDRMRMHNVVPVPVKKATIFRERPTPFGRPAPIYQGSNLNRPQGSSILQNVESQQTIAPKTNQSETALLEEITKKYILIPRSLTNDTDYTSKANVTDLTDAIENGDWKSKYNILDELKSADIEGIEHYSTNDPFSIKKHHHNTNVRDQNADTPEHESGTDQKHTLKYKEEVPEKHIETDYGIHNYPEKPGDNNENKKFAIKNEDQNVQYPKNKYLQEKNYNTPEKEMETGQAGEEFMPLYGSQTKLGYRVVESNKDKEVNSYLKQDSAVKETHNSSANETLNAAEYNTVGEATAPISNKEVKLNNAGFLNLVNAQVTLENFEPLEDKDRDVEKVVRPVENLSIIQDIYKTDANDEEHVQYPLDPINTQEFTPHDGVILKDGENINPEGYVLNENYVNPSVVYNYDSQQVLAENVAQPELTSGNDLNPALNTENYEQPQTNEEDTVTAVVQNFDVEQIQEFEAEQENMFYQDPNAAYDPTSGDASYAQDENYQGNEQYQYYEGVEQEHHNPVEINEHEEATERYDPSYQEQYGPTQYDYTQQGYEQQGYEQHGEQQGYEQKSEQLQQGYEQQGELLQQGYEQQGELLQQGYEQQGAQLQQSYEQQGAQLQQGYEQQKQGYEQPVAEEPTQPHDEFGVPASAYDMNQVPRQYEETEEYDHHEQGYENVQSVEQELDYEQGFSETETRAAEQIEQVKQK